MIRVGVETSETYEDGGVQMNHTKSTKKALLVSVLSLILCFAMFAGTTFAWFTDSVTSVNNKIVAGTLDVQLLMNTGSGYQDISDSTSPIFGKGSIAQADNAETLWEPGKTQVAYLAIKNNGNLALKYTVDLHVENVSKDLYKAMEYVVTPDAQYKTITSWAGNGNHAVPGNQTIAEDISLAPGATHYFALSIHMDERVGNEYQGGEVNFDLTVLATQDTVESDSFGSDYDASSKQKWNEDGVLKVLSIGNSYSDDALEYFYQIAEDVGVQEIKVGNLYVASCSLATHLSNAQNNTASYTYHTNTDGTWVSNYHYTIKAAVESENWDYITFQQKSGDSGLAETYNDLQALIDIVEPLCPRAKLVWHMTWSSDNNANYGGDRMKMYQAIVSSVMSKIETNDRIALVIPVGTAIQNARTSYLGEAYKILNRDWVHLSYGIGRYIAGLTFVHTLTGLPIDDVTYVPTGQYSVSDDERRIAIESVKNAVENPYMVTNSVYGSIDSVWIDTVQ